MVTCRLGQVMPSTNIWCPTWEQQKVQEGEGEGFDDSWIGAIISYTHTIVKRPE